MSSNPSDGIKLGSGIFERTIPQTTFDKIVDSCVEDARSEVYDPSISRSDFDVHVSNYTGTIALTPHNIQSNLVHHYEANCLSGCVVHRMAEGEKDFSIWDVINGILGSGCSPIPPEVVTVDSWQIGSDAYLADTSGGDSTTGADSVGPLPDSSTEDTSHQDVSEDISEDVWRADAEVSHPDDIIEDTIDAVDINPDDTEEPDVATDIGEGPDTTPIVEQYQTVIEFDLPTSIPQGAEVCLFDQKPDIWEIKFLQQGSDLYTQATTGGIPPIVFLREPGEGVETNILIESSEGRTYECQIDHYTMENDPTDRWQVSCENFVNSAGDAVYDEMHMLAIGYNVEGAQAVYLELEGYWMGTDEETNCASSFSTVYQQSGE